MQLQLAMNKQIFGLLLLIAGIYVYSRAASGQGFLGMTNPKWPGLVTAGAGVLFLTGVV